MIITNVQNLPDNLPYAYLNIFLISSRLIRKQAWVKQTMDYFANVAYF